MPPPGRGFLLALLIVSAAANGQAYKSAVGFTSLQTRLGGTMPTGATIAASHVEGEVSGNYLPDTIPPTNAQFVGKSVVARSGLTGVSSHATNVGYYLYGSSSSMSPAISAIDCYGANNWINNGALGTLSFTGPLVEVNRVQNHSWIGTTSNDAVDGDILRRIDLLAQRDGVVILAGVGNSGGSAIPKLACSAYNVLAIGRTSATSSWGPTVIDAPGRIKPSLVAPLDATSWAAPVVGAAAALLLESADQQVDAAGLSLPEKGLLTRALLMGGATKSEFSGNWRRGLATPSTDGTIPLDYRYGAGELNVDNSHRILTAGRQAASITSDVAATGWDSGMLDVTGRRYYFFEVPSSGAGAVSILLTWNRHVGFAPDYDADLDVDLDDLAHFDGCRTGPSAGPVSTTCADADFDNDDDVDLSDFAFFQRCLSGPGVALDPRCRAGSFGPMPVSAEVADLNLYLHTATGYITTGVVDRSISPIDNVEHIYLATLTPGRYAIEITADRTWEFALTWDMDLP